ncbi:MAG: VWA domain-containing protein [Bryobacteraceae bacterium]|nr:VWA domain-containing protein [Bryobacteraceae bacterium]
MRFQRQIILAALCVCAARTAPALTVTVENEGGSISVRVVDAGRITVNRSSPQREATTDDVAIIRQGDVVLVRANPPDGAPIDIEVQMPYRVPLQAQTTTGAISVEGLIPHVRLATRSGDIRLTMPWEATRLSIEAANAPANVQLPEGIRFSRRETPGRWRLNDRLPDMKITYGLVEVRAEAPGSLTLARAAIPDDSPVKLPWLAAPILDGLLPGRRGQTVAPQTASDDANSGGVAATDERMPVFTSSVRLVNLTAAINNNDGHPIKDLKPEDFEVLEDNVPQTVTFAGSEDVPFNLALLLDLSGSTQRDRAAMKEAAKRFVDITRRHDRVAAYALANNIFQVMAPLTEDRKELEELIDAIPDISGGSPIYDSIVLAYAQEFRQRPSERNALVIISDGVDNQLQGVGAPSKVNYNKLARAAEGMNMAIYPVFLDPFTRVPPPAWARRARERMSWLAQVSGGRLFPAQSIQDLESVYPQVAEELRSVYTIAYYPRNQDFDGSWRRVQIKVKRPGAKVRSRTGYFAH